MIVLAKLCNITQEKSAIFSSLQSAQKHKNLHSAQNIQQFSFPITVTYKNLPEYTDNVFLY